jgi:PPOX class probable F420-dependent enzyme
MPRADTAFGARVQARLRDERVIWLTTVGRDGTPQPNPVWFVLEDASTVLVYNRADALRLVHIKERPRVALHLNANPQGGDVIVLTGEAVVENGMPASHEHDGYLGKYRDAMSRVSGSPAAFSTEYPVPLIVHIGRVRGF